MKIETVGDDNILNIVKEIETLISEDRTIEDYKRDFPDENDRLEEVLNNYISDNDLKRLKTEFPDEWNYLNKKLAYPHE